MTYMTGSKRLVVGSANRMFSFYSLEQLNASHSNPDDDRDVIPVSRIEDLVAIPMCLEYYLWEEKTDGKYETLLCGDGLGVCHMWNFEDADWHYYQYKAGSHEKPGCTQAQ